MSHNLTALELISLLTSVFKPGPDDSSLTIFVDLPDEKTPDNAAWMDRRRIATEWYASLVQNFLAVPFTALNYCSYPNVGTNNGELPPAVTLIDGSTRSSPRPSGGLLPLRQVLEESSIVLAVTEFSATAPLKILAREIGFRGATLPGFNRRMIPALGLDYEKVNSRVMRIKERMDQAQSATVVLMASGTAYELELDLRFTSAHASGGIIQTRGTVANLPSGEAYIVPFEGDGAGMESRTSGLLPVQFNQEVVVFRIEKNKAFEVVTSGKESAIQAAKLASEPAYGNISELGMGVLGEWGVEPVGNILLDEKLGLHIAFGRSDHFGGRTGPGAFHDPGNVIHIDWVYVPSCQPLIQVEEVVFHYDSMDSERVMASGKFAV
jgi:hypothetical protein